MIKKEYHHGRMYKINQFGYKDAPPDIKHIIDLDVKDLKKGVYKDKEVQKLFDTDQEIKAEFIFQKKNYRVQYKK